MNPASGFHNRETLLAQRAFLWFVGDNVQLQHRKVLCVKADFAITPVNDVAHAGQPCISFLHQVNNLENGSTGCHDILYDEDAFPRMDLKAATQFHHAILPFGENRANLEHSAHLRANNNSSYGGRYHQLHVCVFKVPRDLAAEQMQVLGILEHPCALEILWAVKTGCESEMPLEKGFCLAENFEDLFFREFHGDGRLTVGE